MGPDTIVPLAGMLTGLAITIGVAAAFVKIFQGPVGQAIARRLTGRHGAPDAGLAHEVEELRVQLEQVQQRLVDAEERLDFSERLLTQRAESAERRG